MFVLGIDPGLSRCGYGLVRPNEPTGHGPGATPGFSASAAGHGPGATPGFSASAAGHGVTGVAAGVIETDPGSPLHERLRVVQQEIHALMDEYRPTSVVVERVFFQVNARTAMSVGQASGLALAAAAEFGCEVAQYTSNEVKQALVGYGSATKSQVQQMVARVLELDDLPRPPDVADALALAVCHLTTMPLRRAVADAGRREGTGSQATTGLMTAVTMAVRQAARQKETS